MSNRIDQAIRDAEGAVDKVTDINRTFALQSIKSNPHTAAIFNELCAQLRALYTWLDGIGDGAPDASALQKEALWRCATITETLEKVGEL